MSELMVLFQALLLVAGWLLFLKAQAELRAQSARQSLTGEMEALRQTIDALLNRLLEEAERAEQRIRAETERAIGEIRTVGCGQWVVGSGEGNRQWAVGSGDTNLTPPVPNDSPHPPQPSLSHREREGVDTPLPMGEGLRVRAETPLSHSVGEGQGMRAETHHSPFPTPPIETSEPENRYNIPEQERPTFGVVAILAEQGLSVQEIARQTGYAPGEVELILNLKRHLSEENR